MCQQGPGQNAQAALIQTACDDAVKPLRCDLQILNGQWAWLAWHLSKGTVTNSIFGGHSEELRIWGQTHDDSIVACFFDEGGLSILMRALLTYQNISQQGPDQNAQATLV